jgi:hypothetical protein
MKKESLEEAILMIIDRLDKSDIPVQDKLELMINLRCFLNVDKYENNIKILSKGSDNR